MNTIHINVPTFSLGRTVRKCTTCCCRRRFLVRVYAWYPSKWICGGCGYVWDEMGREQTGKKRRAENREYVRKYWSGAKSHRDAIQEVFEGELGDVGQRFVSNG